VRGEEEYRGVGVRSEDCLAGGASCMHTHLFVCCHGVPTRDRGFGYQQDPPLPAGAAGRAEPSDGAGKASRSP
jgi:hypothetical protein